MKLKDFISEISYHKKLSMIGPLRPQVPAHLRSLPQILIDGGANFVESNPISFTIGDFDSSQVKPELLLKKNKPRNDFSYGLKFIPEKATTLNFFGLLGGRRDHEIMNLTEAHRFLLKRKNTTIHWWEGRRVQILSFSAGTYTFEKTGIFSLFMFKKGSVALTGRCQYQVTEKKPLKPLSSHGLSNIGSGEISLVTNAPVFIYL